MKTKEECREQIQEAIRTYLDGFIFRASPAPTMASRREWLESTADDLCQIVVDNFKRYEN